MRSHQPQPPGPCPFEIDDGAYILGALSPAERNEYERHLAACPPCRDGMAQLAVLPGLLSRLDSATAQRSITAPPSLLPRVLAAVRAERAAQRRRRRTLATVAGLVATVAVATIVGIGVLLNRPTPDPATPVAFRPMTVGEDSLRVDAEIGLQEQQTGTLVAVRCLYHGPEDRTWQVWLIVYPRDEEAETIGSWIATGGTPVEVSATTHHPADQIARIELQTPNHTTIAWWSP